MLLLNRKSVPNDSVLEVWVGSEKDKLFSALLTVRDDAQNTLVEDDPISTATEKSPSVTKLGAQEVYIAIVKLVSGVEKENKITVSHRICKGTSKKDQHTHGKTRSQTVVLTKKDSIGKVYIGISMKKGT